MQLNNISISQSGRLDKINRVLKEHYGFALKNLSPDEARSKLALVELEIASIKSSGQTAELSKRILIAEGLGLLADSPAIVPQVAMTGPYEQVVSWLAAYVTDCVEVGDDYESAIESAMREYRSSKWRFPEDKCEDAVRAKSLEMIMEREKNYMNVNNVTEGADDIWSRAGMDVAGKFTGDRRAADAYIKPGSEASRLELTPKDDSEEGVSYPYGKDALRRNAPKNEEVVTEDDFSDIDAGGGKVTYPRGKQALRKPGSVRRSASSVPGYSEIDAGNGRVTYPRGKDALNRANPSRPKVAESMVSHLRTLLETELDQADSIVSAKGMGSDLQEMIEKIGRLQNEQLPNITDQMRDAYAAETAANFQHLTMSSLQGIMDSLYAAKDQIDNSVDHIVGGGAVSAPTDLSSDMSAGSDQGVDDFSDVGDDEFSDEDATVPGAEEDVDAALADIEPLGREMKESAIRVLEAQIARLTRKLRETK